MDFSEALKLLKQGARIRRKSWSGIKHLLLLRGCINLGILPHIGIVIDDDKFAAWAASSCDILAEDWVRYYKE